MEEEEDSNDVRLSNKQKHFELYSPLSSPLTVNAREYTRITKKKIMTVIFFTIDNNYFTTDFTIDNNLNYLNRIVEFLWRERNGCKSVC